MQVHTTCFDLDWVIIRCNENENRQTAIAMQCQTLKSKHLKFVKITETSHCMNMSIVHHSLHFHCCELQCRRFSTSFGEIRNFRAVEVKAVTYYGHVHAVKSSSNLNSFNF
jgi:prephenate dehydrogenase